MKHLKKYKNQMFHAYNRALTYSIEKHLGINALFDSHKEEKERIKFLKEFQRLFYERTKHYSKFLAENKKQYKKEKEDINKLHKQIETILLNKAEQEIHHLAHKITEQHLIDLGKTTLNSILVQIKSHKIGNL